MSTDPCRRALRGAHRAPYGTGQVLLRVPNPFVSVFLREHPAAPRLWGIQDSRFPIEPDLISRISDLESGIPLGLRPKAG